MNFFISFLTNYIDIQYLLTPPAALPTVSASTCPLFGGMFSDPFDEGAIFPGMDGGGMMLDSSVEACV